MFPEESAKYISSPANDGIKFPNELSPENEISQLTLIFLLLATFSNFLGSSSSKSFSSLPQNFKELNEEHDDSSDPKNIIKK
jgi:hypothetical protein